jgi:D-sedoheptulose 7-phosphate isomerase
MLERSGMKDKIKKTITDHKRLVDVFEKTGIDAAVQIAQAIIDCFKNGGTVYLCGNGGSAADCQHVAAELVGRFRMDRKAMPAVALSTDTSLLTSVGNDYGFEEIFRRQVEGLVSKGDILWAFSTSGKSPNIISAALLAKEKGATVISFTGRGNSELEKISDLCFCIDTPAASSAQEIHQLAYHIICELVEEQAAGK